MTTDHNEATENKKAAIGPGEVLKQARERLGMSQKDVADRLRLRITVIEEIENNRFDNEKITTFTRGYVRSYAKCVHLDEEEMLSMLSAADSMPQDEQMMHSFSRRTKREAHDSRVMILTWVIAISVVGVTALKWWQSVQEPSALLDAPSSTLTEVIETETTQTDIALEPPVPTQLPEVDGDDVADLPMTEVTEQAESAVDEVPVLDDAIDLVEESEPVIVSDSSIVIRFDGDCWVDIRDAKGKRLITGIKKQGETFELEGEAPFKLVLGAPDVVELRYQGENIDLSKFGVGKVARFTLPQ
ncbi:RodZ domain-containing protein [Thaumasiovibrio sp. DFM-14]|uniref:RodZ domain-containing protein n=1 Tax=Thaumasiovibrio sp. DFM-14 TaxID=3384792 RepID=UPI00399F5456